MNKYSKWILKEFLNLLLCVAIAIIAGLAINTHFKRVIERTGEDIQRTDWVMAAKEVAENDMVTLFSNDVK